MDDTHYTVSEVARLAHVSVRTLHHYDDIGLLSPARRTAAGYRMYSAADLHRLHEILIFRELGLALDVIQRVIDAPAEERARVLREHRGALDERVRRTEAVIRAVDAKLDALEKGDTMTTDGMFDGFDDFDHAQYAEEAEQRWGDTDAFRESARRTKGYTEQDWAVIRGESEAILRDWAALFTAGEDAASPRARAVAERHRAHLSRWFYECSHAFHDGLADMFTADPRFRETYDRHGAGMADFVAASIRANGAAATRA